MSVVKLSRREFLRHGIGAGAGLALAVSLQPRPAWATPNTEGAAEQGFEANAFVHIGVDNRVTVTVKHIEFGQGVFTGLATLVAEELDAEWSQMLAVGAPADPARYYNTNWGDRQGTGGSSSMNNSWTQMRRAGATARAMLVNAASVAWQVRASEITVARGRLAHAASGREASFGELAAAAARQPLPKNVTLKVAARFVHIGKNLARLDRADKVSGRAIYTQDFTRPGMLTALVAHAPRFGARAGKVDGEAALAVAGVQQLVELPHGVAVVARDFWSAKLGRDALRIEWDESSAFKLGTRDILERFRALSRSPGLVARDDGDVETALAAAHTVLEAEFEFPYLAHAAMEPMNCVAQVHADRCELWYGVQGQSNDLRNLSAALGIAQDRIRLNMLYAGGSFGRRSDRHSDFVVEAARIAAAVPGSPPVKLMWTREDDMRAGAYRPLNVHRLRGGLDKNGNIVAWQHRIVGQSILSSGRGADDSGEIDRTGTEGAANLPYPIPHLNVEVHQPYLDVPVLWWRSVGHTHTAFSTETFLDELAAAAGRDPYELRVELLTNDPRRLAVLHAAARAAGWGTPLGPGRGRGIAVHYAFKTWVAEVAEVTLGADGDFSVDRIVAAVDCGIAVNPDIVRAQIEGGIGYALSTVFGSAITLDDGRVVEDNFDTYKVLRLAQMPDVEVHIVPSDEAPTGVGEPGVPPLAPAVANALFAAGGRRYRAMPFTSSANT